MLADGFKAEYIEVPYDLNLAEVNKRAKEGYWVVSPIKFENKLFFLMCRVAPVGDKDETKDV